MQTLCKPFANAMQTEKLGSQGEKPYLCTDNSLKV